MQRLCSAHVDNPRREQRLAGLLAAQEPLLYSCAYLLLNMAEDQAVEQKMLRRVGWECCGGGKAWGPGRQLSGPDRASAVACNS